MTQFEYYIKQVDPKDLNNFLKYAGLKGWRLLQVIIFQRMKQTGFALSDQLPQMEIKYEAIMIREKTDNSEDIEPEEEG